MTKSVYAAFDRYPSSKGAATHIGHTVDVLFRQFPEGRLFVLGDHKLSDEEDCEAGKIVRFRETIPNFLKRTRAWDGFLRAQAGDLKDVAAVQFRDPWSGIPLLESMPGSASFIYEVNGLPSIELPYHFPALQQSLLRKIRSMEQRCLSRADMILTPSQTIAGNLSRISPSVEGKIHVIPNGAIIPPDRPRPEDAPPEYLLYFGALQRWQGIGTMLRAFAEVKDLPLQLVICSSNKPRFSKPWKKLCARLEIEDRVIWKSQLTRTPLQGWIAHARATLAPLTETSRNLEQGCSPLKVLESMAAGTPVIASDLPVVREITDQYLVRADRPEAFAFAIRHLYDDPDLREKIGENGRRKISDQFTWERHRSELGRIYSAL